MLDQVYSLVIQNMKNQVELSGISTATQSLFTTIIKEAVADTITASKRDNLLLSQRLIPLMASERPGNGPDFGRLNHQSHLSQKYLSYFKDILRLKLNAIFGEQAAKTMLCPPSDPFPRRCDYVPLH